MHYEPYFDLKSTPFSISPDPRYLFLTPQHREALAHLLYGVNSQGGFVMLTGEVGAGKTTMCQCLLEQLPENTDVAYILNPKLRPREFLAAFCDELKLDYDASSTSLKYFIDLISRHLLQSHSKGRNTVLMVDEAQNLSADLIEHLRLLTNLETHEKKLLQILLIGQPELRDMVDRPELKQVAQRITARFHLYPLNKSEIAAYVKHRLKIAGAKRPLFKEQALKRLWGYTRGVPRLINIICDRALLGACVSGHAKVSREILDKAAAEVFGETQRPRPAVKQVALAALLVIVVAGSSFAAFSYVKRNGLPWDISHLTSDLVARFKTAKPVQIVGPGTETPAEVMQDEGLDLVANREQAAADPIPADEPVLNDSDEPMPVEEEDLALVQADSSLSTVQQTSLQLPQDVATGRLLKQSLSKLMALWGVSAEPGSVSEACRIIVAEKLACMDGQANLAQLARFNRPAMITLYDPQWNSYSAVVESIKDGEVYLSINGESQQVSAVELGKWWYGDYLLFWEVPPGYVGNFAEETYGPVVGWLKKQLGAESEPMNDFTPELTQRVRAFQRSNGLVPDGIVGPKTIIAINNLHDNETPRLVSDMVNR